MPTPEFLNFRGTSDRGITRRDSESSQSILNRLQVVRQEMESQGEVLIPTPTINPNPTQRRRPQRRRVPESQQSVPSEPITSETIDPYISQLQDSFRGTNDRIGNPPTITYMDGQYVDSIDAAPLVNYSEPRSDEVETQAEEATRGTANRYTYDPREIFRDSYFLDRSYRLIMQHLENPALYPLPPVLQNELEVNRLRYIYHPRYVVQQSGRWMLGEDSAIDPFLPELQRLERYLDQQPSRGTIAGMGLGLVLNLRATTIGIRELTIGTAETIISIPEIVNQLLELDRGDFEEACTLLRDLLLLEIRDQTISRQIIQIILEGFQHIGAIFENASTLSNDRHFVRASAEYTQIALQIIEMIEAIHGVLILARHSPEMLNRLQSGSRRLRASLSEIGIPQTGDSEFTRFLRELLRDDEGAATFGTSGGRTRQAPITRSETRLRRPIESTDLNQGQTPARVDLTNVPLTFRDGTPITRSLRVAYNSLIQRGIDLTNPYTLERMNQIYNRLRSDDITTMLRRAEGGELRTLIRYADMPDVERVRFVRPSQTSGSRTPDIEVSFLGNTRSQYVEIRTITQAPVGQRGGMYRGTDAPAHLNDAFIYENSIQEKIMRGQISASNPGTVVFHTPRSIMNDNWLPTWQETFDSILRRVQTFQPGLLRIEVTTGDGGLLVFSPPNWQGIRVQ